MPPRLSPVAGQDMHQTIGRPRGQSLYRSRRYTFDRGTLKRSMFRHSCCRTTVRSANDCRACPMRSSRD